MTCNRDKALLLVCVVISIISAATPLSAQATQQPYQLISSPVDSFAITNSLSARPTTTTSPMFFNIPNFTSNTHDTRALAQADLNHDGYPDIVAASQCFASDPPNCRFGQFSVLLSNGDGSFKDALKYQTGGGT